MNQIILSNTANEDGWFESAAIPMILVWEKIKNKEKTNGQDEQAVILSTQLREGENS